MKILYDHQVFSMQRYGGISRYFCEVIRGVGKRNGFEICLPIVLSANAYLKELDTVQYRHLERIVKGFNWLVSLINRRHMIRWLADRGHSFDVFHPTYYDPYFLPFISDRPSVLTIYDMIHEIFPGYFSPLSKVSANKKRLAQRAARIIAISENTKRDIVNIFGIDSDKIRVIHLGLSSLPSDSDGGAPFPGKYLLFVGQRYEYKNFLTMAESVRKLLIRHNMSLICFGGTGWTQKEAEKLKEWGISDRVFPLSGDDRLLARLYRNAVAFICPSRYEGFGIPVLEAMACGCPVASSNASSLPEVGGDAAAYFSPDDKASIVGAVERIVTDADFRKGLVERGLLQSRKFTWEGAVARISEVYEEASAKAMSAGSSTCRTK